MKKQNLFWPSNEQIRGEEFRVIDSQGKQVGILKRDEALSLAKKEGLDLVLIAKGAKPPVVKIIDYGKHKYREEKKLKEVQKKNKVGDLKEVRFSPFIAEGDYQTRLKRIKNFLGDKSKVRLIVFFKRRQMGSKQFGYDLFRKILIELGDGLNIDMKPKFLGRKLAMIISPTSKYEKEKKEQSKNKKTGNK